MSVTHTDIELDRLPPVLDPTHLQALYRVSRNTVLEWAREGVIPAGFKMGRLRRWKRDVILADLAQRQEGGADAPR